MVENSLLRELLSRKSGEAWKMDIFEEQPPVADPFWSLNLSEGDLNDVHDLISGAGGAAASSASLEDQLFAGLPSGEQEEIGHIVNMLRQDSREPQHHHQQQQQAEAMEESVVPMEAESVTEHSYNFPPPPNPPPPTRRPLAWTETETAKPPLTIGIAKPFNAAPDLASPASSTSVSPQPLLDAVRAAPPQPSRMQTRRREIQVPKMEALSPTSDNEDSDGDSTSAPSSVRRVPREGRRTAHNLIEKKYRCSINDKIAEIKVALAGPDAKLSKSAVLKKALEHIQHLETENAELRSENVELRSRLGLSSGEAVKKPQPSTGLSASLRPMMDRSKLSIFVFMLALIAFNPVGMMLGSSTGEGVVVGMGGGAEGVAPMPGARVLHSFSEGLGRRESEESEAWHEIAVSKFLGISALNCIVVACVLARLLVYGEPLYPAQDEDSALGLHKAAAEAELCRREPKAAAFQLGECLRALGRPLPSSGLDEAVALAWQLVRQGLNRLLVGRWLARQARSGLSAKDVRHSHARTALLYHQLHQLHLLGHGGGSALGGLAQALAAVNLAEAAGDEMEAAPLVSIYAHLGLRLRKSLPSLPFLGLHFLAKAARVAKKEGAELPPNLFWLFEPAGKVFLASKAAEEVWSRKLESFMPFAGVPSLPCPLDLLTAAFKVELMERSLSSPVARKAPSELSGAEAEVRELKELCYLLLETSPECDGVGRWWGHLMACGVDWLRGETQLAKAHYEDIRAIPDCLKTEPLAMGFGYAFCVRRLCLFDRAKLLLVPEHTQKGAAALAKAKAQRISQSRLCDLMMERIHDWLLTGLLETWAASVEEGQEYWSRPSPPAQAQLYHRLLHSYRTMLKSRPTTELGLRLESFAIAERCLCGANPTATSHRLLRLARLAKAESMRNSDRERIRLLESLHGL